MLKEISTQSIKLLQGALDALPEKEPEKVSMKTAITLLTPQINSLLKRGYSIADVIDVLGTTEPSFVGMKVNTLKSYLKDASSDATPKVRSTARRPKPAV